MKAMMKMSAHKASAASVVVGVALGCLLLTTAAGASPKAALDCTAGTKTATRTVDACTFGAPVAVGPMVLLPKACRLPLDGGFVDRHTIEIRDAKTGAKRGQSSLRPKRAKKSAPMPAVGQIIGGAFPLYVFGGGIAAVDPTNRKADLVLESSGTLAAAARHGEVLAVIDALPASKTFPKGALEWTVIDFGSSEMLGQQRIAGTALDAAGIGKEKGKIVAWLRRKAKGKDIEIYAAVRGRDGKPVSKDGNLRAGVRPAGPASAGAGSVAPAGLCPVSMGLVPVNVGRPLLSTRGVAVSQAATRSHHLAKIAGQKGRCLAMTRADRNGQAWALIHDGKRASLTNVTCKRAASASPKPAKKRSSKKKKAKK